MSTLAPTLHAALTELWCQRELLQPWKRGAARAAPAQLLAEVLKVHHLEGVEALLWQPQFMQMICPTQLEPPTPTHTQVHSWHAPGRRAQLSPHRRMTCQRTEAQNPPSWSTAQLSCPSRLPTMVKRSNRSLHTLAVETLAKALGLHQLGAHLTLPVEWLLGASTGGLCSCNQADLGSI